MITSITPKALGLIMLAALIFEQGPLCADSLERVRTSGVLRHLGIPYANFISGAGDGMDMELLQGFAAHLGVRYEFVPTGWDRIFGDLLGREVLVRDGVAALDKPVPVRGDVAANGITILKWRDDVIDFAMPSFPNQVWLMARSDSPLQPIASSGNLEEDILAARRLLDAKTVLCKTGTCLDPALYNIEDAGAVVVLFSGGLNDMAPALMQKRAELSLLDVPDALVAMEKWPGQLKVLGPLSLPQEMAAAFAPEAASLREAFNAYLKSAMKDGSFRRLLSRYYPYVEDYYPEFFHVLESR